MESSREILAGVLEALPDAAMAIDGARIVAANRRAADLVGRVRDDLLDAPFESVCRDLRALATLARVAAGGAPASEAWVLDGAGGAAQLVDVALGRMAFDGRSAVLAVVRRAARDRVDDDDVRKSEERLRQAVRVSEIGIFDHDHASDVHYWSARQYEMYCWPPSLPIDVPRFLERLHVDDRARIAEALRGAHDPSSDGSFDVEHRIVWPDGQVRWISTRSVTLFEGEGASRRAVRTVGACVDLTEAKFAHEALERFRHSIDQASDSIFWLEHDGDWRRSSTQRRTSWGWRTPTACSSI